MTSHDQFCSLYFSFKRKILFASYQYCSFDFFYVAAYGLCGGLMDKIREQTHIVQGK